MSTSLETRDGLLAGVPASSFDIRCEHGSSRFFVVPGRDPAANLAALEILRLRHGDRHACACTDAPPERSTPH